MTGPEKVTVRCLMQVTDDALHQPGDVIEVLAEELESLVEAGAVEVVEPEAEPGAEAQSETEPPPAPEPKPEPTPEPEPEPEPPKPKTRTRRKKARTKRSS